MNAIKQSFMEKYSLSSYEFAQLTFLAKTFASDFSKMVIMALLFHDRLAVFLFALLVLMLIRCPMGGIHFDTYFRCLIGSCTYFWLAIVLLPRIAFPLPMQILCTALCAAVCCCVGPAFSPNRLPSGETFKRQCTFTAAAFMFLYAFILYIMPNSQLLAAGFWIIILHTLQLLAAKYIRKERS